MGGAKAIGIELAISLNIRWLVKAAIAMEQWNNIAWINKLR